MLPSIWKFCTFVQKEILESRSEHPTRDISSQLEKEVKKAHILFKYIDSGRFLRPLHCSNTEL